MPRGREANPARKPIKPSPPRKPKPPVDPALQCCQEVSKKLDVIDRKVSAIIVEVSDLDSKLDGTNRRLTVLGKKIDDIAVKLDGMDSKLDQIVAAIPTPEPPEPAANISINLGEPADKPR